MTDFERILLECRYLLSLNKNYQELSLIFHKDISTIYDDLNIKLPKYDSILFTRVNRVLNDKNSS